MTQKQTRCPNCQTVYKVSVTQLTISQGMVCCPKCSAEFNALVHLVKIEKDESDLMLSSQHSPYSQTLDFEEYASETNVLDIFERKIEGSNINLRTYLNNLNTFNKDPITNFPSLNLSSQHNIASPNPQTHSKLYYLIWAAANSILALLLIFQILWFNPNFLDRHPFINAAFIATCHAFNCETIDERYMQIKVAQVNVIDAKNESTVFKGQLINQYEKGLELPLIKIALMKDDKVILNQIIPPSEYLIDSLNGITQIPTKSPYRFEFSVNKPKISFDRYKLEVIRP